MRAPWTARGKRRRSLLSLSLSRAIWHSSAAGLFTAEERNGVCERERLCAADTYDVVIVLEVLKFENF